MSMKEMLRQANNHIVRCCSTLYSCANNPGCVSLRLDKCLNLTLLKDLADLLCGRAARRPYRRRAVGVSHSSLE